MVILAGGTWQGSPHTVLLVNRGRDTSPGVQIELPTIEGLLVRRYKRFLTDVKGPDGEVLVAHCPNTGSLKGCLEEGARVVLRDSQDAKRKLRYTFQSIEVNGSWGNVDTGLPNALVAEAIQDGLIEGLAGYDSLRREVKYGKASRIDVLLERDNGERCYVEVKSTTMAEGSQARFPDAVTSRGLKHLFELRDMVREGHRAVIFFCVSRSDVTTFAPADDIDPAYGAALSVARQNGVEALCYACTISPTAITLDRALPLVGV